MSQRLALNDFDLHYTIFLFIVVLLSMRIQSFRASEVITYIVSQVGAWRERIIVCSGKYGLTNGLVKAFMDSGAKAVISSSMEPPDSQTIAYYGMDVNGSLENGKFVIGDEEAEESEPEPVSPISDWEDSDAEKNGNHDMDDEEYLAQFMCLLYDKLFREGVTVDTALQQALRLHPKLKYSCHLPNVL